jgi:hypothetical protein
MGDSLGGYFIFFLKILNKGILKIYQFLYKISTSNFFFFLNKNHKYFDLFFKKNYALICTNEFKLRAIKSSERINKNF